MKKSQNIFMFTSFVGMLRRIIYWAGGEMGSEIVLLMNSGIGLEFRQKRIQMIQYYIQMGRSH